MPGAINQSYLQEKKDWPTSLSRRLQGVNIKVCIESGAITIRRFLACMNATLPAIVIATLHITCTIFFHTTHARSSMVAL